jgi:hypothetical protein
MHRRNLISLLLPGLLIILPSLYLPLVYFHQLAYSHLLSSNENASLLELFHQIHVQAQLVQSIFPLNNTLAHEHAKDAAEVLFNKNWTTVVADKNIVHNLLLPSLTALMELTKSPSSSYPELKGEVAALDDILSRFTVSYIGDKIFNNATIQALVISEIANDINYKYGKALGVVVNSSNMMMMTMPHPMITHNRQPSSIIPSTNDNTNSSISKMDSMMMNGSPKKSNITKNYNNTVLDVADYQTAEALAAEELQIFNKNLKPIIPANTNHAIAEVQTYLQQLKDGIHNIVPLIHVMTIIHVYIHPMLIATFNLQLKG